MGVSFRRTRIVWLTVIAVAVFLLVGYRQGTIFSLPTSFSLSRNGESVLANTVIPRVKPQEIHGLLHLVAQSSGQLATDGSIDAAASLPLSAYAAAAGSGGNWDAHVELLLRNAPVVVFSKVRCELYSLWHSLIRHLRQSYCPCVLILIRTSSINMVLRYSKRGKALLESYKLVPEPVIVELDQRGA
jgi:hypothetical protein